MSLILFLSSLLLGTPSDKEAENSSEEQKNKSLDKIKSEIIIDQPVNSISISGNPKKKIMQDEFYIFTPLVKDIERNNLQFYIKNKPNWAVFDSRTGSLSGSPVNQDVGVNKNITISVVDSKGRKVSLAPFVIEVINTNDRPFIYGTPDETIEIGKTYKFTPKVKDIDLDIAKDTLIFSIKNKPRWATFNKQTGTLNGNPIAYQDREGQTSVEIEESEEIIITVTDLYGASDSLKPFIIDIGHISTDILTEPIKSIRTSQISTTDVQIFSSHFDSVANNPNQSEANSTSLISDNNNLLQQIEHTDKTIKTSDPPIDETTGLDDDLNDNSLAQRDKDTEDKTDTLNQSDDLNNEKESLAESNEAVDKDQFNEIPNAAAESETGANSNQQAPASNTNTSEPETVVATDNQTNSITHTASNETSKVFGTIYPNTFYMDGVKTYDYCFFEKTIYFESAQIKQKIYYVFYEQGGTKMYPFSNTIYQDLVVSTSPREQDQAVKIWDNIKSSRVGARCSEDPLNHLP
jgi:hypothetical protein